MTTKTTDRQSRTPTVATRLIAACRDPRHHCAVVLVANAGLVSCGAAGPFTAALALHLVLLPINAWRLLQALHKGASPQSPARPLPGARAPVDVVTARRTTNSPWYPDFQAMATAQTVRLPQRRAEQ